MDYKRLLIECPECGHGPHPGHAMEPGWTPTGYHENCCMRCLGSPAPGWVEVPRSVLSSAQDQLVLRLVDLLYKIEFKGWNYVSEALDLLVELGIIVRSDPSPKDDDYKDTYPPWDGKSIPGQVDYYCPDEQFRFLLTELLDQVQKKQWLNVSSVLQSMLGSSLALLSNALKGRRQEEDLRSALREAAEEL